MSDDISPTGGKKRPLEEGDSDGPSSSLPALVELKRLPRVRASVRATEDGKLQLRLAVLEEEEPDTSVFALMSSMQILLDHAQVAKTRTSRELVVERELTSLDRGVHHAQFTVRFTSGDVHTEQRVFAYNGPTVRAEGERECHALVAHGSGLISTRRASVWRLDERHALPARVRLCSPRGAPLYLQPCATSPGGPDGAPIFEPPVQADVRGEAVLALRATRYFVVGSHSAQDVPFDLFVEPEPEAAAAPSGSLWAVNPRVPAAYTVCVGISNYRFISSLEYADDDAVSWCEYLSRGGYEVRLFGDGKSSYAPFVPNAVATEENVRRYVQALVDVLRPGDVFMFASSGHGSGDGRGNSYLCMEDEHGAPTGEYSDVELASDLAAIARTGCKTIVTLDHCFSGGMLDDIQRAFEPERPDQFWACSTCGIAGYGWDDPSTRHGSWTHSFLIRGLEMRFAGQNPPLREAFKYAFSIYPRREQKNLPQCVGNGDLTIF